MSPKVKVIMLLFRSDWMLEDIIENKDEPTGETADKLEKSTEMHASAGNLPESP